MRSTMRTIEKFAAPYSPCDAHDALTMWRALEDEINDLASVDLLGEEDDEGKGPLYRALFDLEATILGYGPATVDEARAIIAVINQYHATGTICSSWDAAAIRASAFLTEARLRKGR